MRPPLPWAVNPAQHRRRDYLALIAGVLREVGCLAVERVQGAGTAPRCAADVSPKWLTGVLRAAFPGVRVHAIEYSGGDAGTTDRARLHITYADPGTAEPPPPFIFVKTAPANPTTRVFVNLFRLGSTEVRFYREIAADIPIERPRTFHAYGAGRAQRFVLVLEDLAARGARFADITSDLSVDQAQRVMRALGRLHARFWDSPRFHGDLAWLRARERNPIYAVERGVCALAVWRGLRGFADLVGPELRAVAPRLITARDALEEAWARGPRTLLHGDAHAGNLYWLPESVGLLDWQVVQCGQGMRDVTYFLITSLTGERRRAHQSDLIGRYLAALREHGVAAPDLDEAWRQYRLHALYAWLATIVTAAATTLQVESIARTGLARSSAAVQELDSVAALDGLPGA